MKHETKRGYVESVCKQCSKSFMARKDSIKAGYGKFCSHTCTATHSHAVGAKLGPQFGEAHHSWKGGEYLTGRGYIKKLIHGHPKADSSGYVYQHIAVVEEAIGRPLAKNEVIHHIDEDRTNNDLNNLCVMDRAEHNRHHRLIDRLLRQGKEQEANEVIASVHSVAASLGFSVPTQGLTRSKNQLHP